MRAAVYYETGSPDVFRYEEVPDPTCGPGEVLISVEAISIEGGDTLNRLGGELSGVPHVVGYQCAGTIVEVGAGIDDLVVGQRVVTVGTDGSHAELRVAGRSFCWPIPDGLPTVEAACVPVAFGTAHDSLFEFGRLEAGQTVLVQAAAGGVGLAAVQLAARAGARVLATASGSDRLARLTEFGVDVAIDYTQVELAPAVREATGGQGVDVVVDGVGGATLQASLHCLAYRGRCISFGDAGRNQADLLDVSGLRGNNQTLSGYFLGAELFFGTRAHGVVASCLDAVARGELHVVVDSTFRLEQAGEAHAHIESRHAFGRVVLVP
jgi:NADPH2:quinone reductase